MVKLLTDTIQVKYRKKWVLFCTALCLQDTQMKIWGFVSS